MSKVVIIFLVIICAMAALTAGHNCQSCGKECANACGSRYFRTCCFNYLRKKRGFEAVKIVSNIDDLPAKPKIIFENFKPIDEEMPFEVYEVDSGILED